MKFLQRNLVVQCCRSISTNHPKPVALSHLVIKGTDDSKSPVLFIHGLFGNKNNWRSIARQVTELTGRTSYSIDLRNHGDSGFASPEESDCIAMSFDVKHFIESTIRTIPESDRSVILVGHSLGGRVSYQLGHLFPSLVEEIVAVDISPISMSSSSLGSLVKYVDAMESVVQSVSEVTGQSLSILRRKADAMLSETIESKLIRDFLVMSLVKSDDGERLRWKFNLPTIKSLLTNGTIRKIELSHQTSYPNETIIIYGTKSDFVKFEDMHKTLTFFPRAKFVAIDDAGHYVHVEQSKKFLNVLLSVIN